jgi:hypothetical protein
VRAERREVDAGLMHRRVEQTQGRVGPLHPPIEPNETLFCKTFVLYLFCMSGSHPPKHLTSVFEAARPKAVRAA